MTFASIDLRNLKLDLNARRLLCDENKIFLRNKEFSLLEYMMKNMGKVISRTEILEEVWDRNIFCNTNTVDVHISKLRKKFNKFDIKSPIKTVHSVGYILE